MYDILLSADITVIVFTMFLMTVARYLECKDLKINNNWILRYGGKSIVIAAQDGGLIITTEVTITDAPEPKSPAMPDMGGMGGMGGMY